MSSNHSQSYVLGRRGVRTVHGRWSRHLAPQFVRFSGVQDGDAVLDVSSGTGVLAAEVGALTPSGCVIGIDPSASYAAFASARRPGNLFRPEVGNAQQLRFAHQSFDRVLSLLVLNVTPDPEKALSEMQRVT